MPSITSHPEDRTILQGSGTTFSVVASGTYTFQYQWQLSTDGGIIFNNITDGGVYSGATESTLRLFNVPINYSGYLYRCRVSTLPQLLNWSDISNAAKLTVVSIGIPPIITTTSLPDGKTGVYYSASLAATGTQPITWDIINGSLPNGLSLNTNSGVISGLTNTAATFSFTVRARNGFNPDDTKVFMIRITSGGITPAITAHPADRTIVERNNTSFTVATAYNDQISYTYQWQYRANSNAQFSNVTNGGIYSGVTTSTLTLSNVTLTSNGYQYRCRVIAPAFSNWTDYSNAATLTVLQTGIPPKITTNSVPEAIKGVSYRITLTATGTLPITWSIIAGKLPDGLTLNANTGEISGIPLSTGTLRFTVRASNGFSPDDTKEFGFVVNNPQPQPVIEIISPTEPVCTVNDKLTISYLKIHDVPSMTYRILFSDEAKAAGFKDITSFINLTTELFLTIDIPENAPTNTYSGVVIITCEGFDNYINEYHFTFPIVNNGVAIVNQPPASQSLCGGTTVAMVVDVSGKANSYQWYKDGKAISGANNKDYVATITGSYHVEIRGECGVIRSNVAVITPPSDAVSNLGIRVKWGNLLYVENAADKYQRFQWFHNGKAVNNAEFVYFSEKEGFLGEYFVRCYKADGSFDESCPIVFNTRTRSSSAGVYPTIVKTNDYLTVNIAHSDVEEEAIVEIYTLQGIQVYSTKITSPTSTIRPDFQHKGNYLVTIKLSSGKVFTEKIIVQ